LTLSRITLHDQVVAVSVPEPFQREIESLFGPFAGNAAGPCDTISIRAEAEGRFAILGCGPTVNNLSRDEALAFFIERVIHALIVNMDSAAVLHAGAVARNGAMILVAGPTGSGKTSLVAWLVDHGFDYLTDEIVVLADGGSRLEALPRALVAKTGNAALIEKFAAFSRAPSLRVGADLAIRPLTANAERAFSVCRLIVMPTYVAGSAIRIELLRPAQAAMRLMACNLNARNLPDGGLGAITALSRAASCISLQYGHFDQLAGVLDTLAAILIDHGFDAAAGRRLMSAFSSSGSPAPHPEGRNFAKPIPSPTPRLGPRKLTIGMATYDDYDGVYFSLQAIRLFHYEILADTEFLVIDNHPDGPCAEALKALEKHLPNYRYVPMPGRAGTAVRHQVFEEAAGEFVLCMDCHVLFASGALSKLIGYFEANRATRDLLQGPLVHDDMNKISTHFQPVWRAGMYGVWETDERGRNPDAPPFEIPMQGLGVFACRRSAWPGFNPLFRGFGGEEGYIHEKFRRAGGRVLCLPFLRWVHRFQRPSGQGYRNASEDRIRNYLIGFHELRLPTAEMKTHFRELLGDTLAERTFAAVEAELRQS
jgi:hypothetical protein